MAKRWNHFGAHGTLECRCVGEGANLQFLRCREEVDYERQLVELLAWTREQAEGLFDKLQLDYFILSSRFDSVWLIDLHKHWGCDCDFKIGIHTSRRMIKTFVARHSLEEFSFHPAVAQRCTCRGL